MFCVFLINMMNLFILYVNVCSLEEINTVFDVYSLLILNYPPNLAKHDPPLTHLCNSVKSDKIDLFLCRFIPYGPWILFMILTT